jgi:hypothetical protein
MRLVVLGALLVILGSFLAVAARRREASGNR